MGRCLKAGWDKNNEHKFASRVGVPLIGRRRDEKES